MRNGSYRYGKQILASCLMLACSLFTARAQEQKGDTIAGPIASQTSGMMLQAGVKEFDGFLLDMNLMQAATAALPDRFKLTIPDATHDYSHLFRLDPAATYSQGLSTLFSTGSGAWSWWGAGGLFPSTDNLQMGSFRLKNGMRINTYGEYNKDGWRMPNPSAMPWQRNNFKGAFELKSSNGSFGLRIEVQHGRNTPF